MLYASRQIPFGKERVCRSGANNPSRFTPAAEKKRTHFLVNVRKAKIPFAPASFINVQLMSHGAA